MVWAWGFILKIDNSQLNILRSLKMVDLGIWIHLSNGKKENRKVKHKYLKLRRVYTQSGSDFIGLTIKMVPQLWPSQSVNLTGPKKMVCTALQQVFGGSSRRQQKRGFGCSERIFLPSQNGPLGPLGQTQAEIAEEKRYSSLHRKRTEWVCLAQAE